MSGKLQKKQVQTDESTKEKEKMKKTVRNYLTGVLFGVLLLIGSMISVQAAVGDHYTVNVDGTMYYTKAFEVLEYLNEERTTQGLGTLTMDQTLMEAAMQRAAECAVNFSHTRPNGSICFTVTSGCSGENIAAGNSTASATFTQWMNSEGHRYNMLDSDHKSVGIGCFSMGGLHYWVQLFSDNDAASPITSGTDRKAKPAVEILENNNSKIQFNLNSYDQTSDFVVVCGKSKELQPGRLNPGWSGHYCELSADSFVWTSSDPSIAFVDENGMVIGKRPGTAVISATVKQGTAETASLTIKCKKDIADTQIADIPSQYENGSAYEPEIEIYDNGEKLEKDVSYTVTYYNNTSAGTARAVIRGIGNYTGSVEKEFVILQRTYVSSLTIKDIPAQIYSGIAYTPEPEVYDGTTLLQKGTDYTVSYFDNVNASTRASVRIKGIGRYTGQTYKYFTINPLDISGEITVKCDGFNYEAYGTADKALADKLEVYYRGVKLTYQTDYTCYSSSYRETEHQICTFVVNLRGNYTGSREYESLEYYYMKPITAQTYTGSAIEPLVQLYASEYVMNVGGKPLDPNAGYQVIYENNVQVGTAKVTVVGNGERYVGKVSGTFEILPKATPSEEPTVTPGPSEDPKITPTPSEEPKVTPTPSEEPKVTPAPSENPKVTSTPSEEPKVTPAPSEDSKVTPAPSEDSKVTPTPSEDSKVTPAPSENPTVTPAPAFTVKVQNKTLYYTGKAQKPKLTVYAGNKKVAAKYYTVTWKNNKYAGEASATVTGKGTYKGYTGKTSFTIHLKKAELTSVKAASSKKVTVRWKKGEGCQGYQIMYSTSSKFKNAKYKLIKKAKTTSCALTNLKKGKKCYVKIRSYRKGSGGYLFSQWSSTKKVKVK